MCYIEQKRIQAGDNGGSMKDDSELQTNDDSIEDGRELPKRIRETDNNRLVPAVLIVLFALIIAGGIYYFLTKGPAPSDAALQPKLSSLEEKIASLEKQIGDLQGKSGPTGPDPVLLHQIEAVSDRVAALEKRIGPAAESKSKIAPVKETASAQKRYHTFKKGETLSGISKKYGIPVEELRKLNDLPKGQSPRIGQKLLISERS